MCGINARVRHSVGAPRRAVILFCDDPWTAHPVVDMYVNNGCDVLAIALPKLRLTWPFVEGVAEEVKGFLNSPRSHSYSEAVFDGNAEAVVVRYRLQAEGFDMAMPTRLLIGGAATQRLYRRNLRAYASGLIGRSSSSVERAPSRLIKAARESRPDAVELFEVILYLYSARSDVRGVAMRRDDDAWIRDGHGVFGAWRVAPIWPDAYAPPELVASGVAVRERALRRLDAVAAS